MATFPRQRYLARRPSGRRAGRAGAVPTETRPGRHLVRAHLLAIGRHVAAAGRAVADLVDQADRGVSRVPTLVRSGPRFPPRPSRAWQLRQFLYLKHQRALQLERRARHESCSPAPARRSRPSSAATTGPWPLRRSTRPAPRRSRSQQHRHRPTARRPLAAIADHRHQEQRHDQQHGKHQDDERLRLRRAQRQAGRTATGTAIRAADWRRQRRIGRAGRAPWGRASPPSTTTTITASAENKASFSIASPRNGTPVVCTSCSYSAS